MASGTRPCRRRPHRDRGGADRLPRGRNLSIIHRKFSSTADSRRVHGVVHRAENYEVRSGVRQGGRDGSAPEPTPRTDSLDDSRTDSPDDFPDDSRASSPGPLPGQLPAPSGPRTAYRPAIAVPASVISTTSPKQATYAASPRPRAVSRAPVTATVTTENTDSPTWRAELFAPRSCGGDSSSTSTESVGYTMPMPNPLTAQAAKQTTTGTAGRRESATRAVPTPMSAVPRRSTIRRFHVRRPCSQEPNDPAMALRSE